MFPKPQPQRPPAYGGSYNPTSTNPGWGRPQSMGATMQVPAWLTQRPPAYGQPFGDRPPAYGQPYSQPTQTQRPPAIGQPFGDRPPGVYGQSSQGTKMEVPAWLKPQRPPAIGKPYPSVGKLYPNRQYGGNKRY